jgi:WD40 repeat protein
MSDPSQSNPAVNSELDLAPISVVNERALNTLNRAIKNSLGQFALILAHCNYANLRAEMVQRLKERCPVELQELYVTASIKTLYTTIQTELDGHRPQALMVFGLEWVTAIDQVLISANQSREQFRKDFQFPILLWVNDDILKKFRPLAPDLKAWTSVPIKFEITTQALIANLEQTADAVFTAILNLGAGRFLDNDFLNSALGSSHSLEMEFAAHDLHNRSETLTPELEASLNFLRGRSADASGDKLRARQYYEESLQYWELERMEGSGADGEDGEGKEGGEVREQDSTTSISLSPHPPIPSPTPLERYGCLLFYLGLWWRQYAALHRADYQAACLTASEYYRRCVKGFLQGERPDLAARFINALGEVLTRLDQNGELASVAETAVDLHQTYSEPIRLAYGYGLLAEVALRQSEWANAKRFAELALTTNDQASPSAINWDWDRHYYRNLYLLLLAQAQQHSGQHQEATAHLETARASSDPQYDPSLYVRILETLRTLYFEQGEYLRAFQIKRDQRSIEQQYGLRAFIGAGRLQPTRYVMNVGLAPLDRPPSVAQEIAVSVRQQDVERLIERITRSDRKLSVVYGQSGVGKSSIMRAGLVPALKQMTIEARDIFPVVLDVYTDWEGALKQRLGICDNPETEVYTESKTNENTDAHQKEQVNEKENDEINLILDQLQHNIERNSLTVLIFDQFEEFFFVYKDRSKRLVFYDFLSRCLNLPFVKVILSLREDYLHFLLEFNRLGSLDVIQNNILDREILYYLGNFSLPDAKSVIQSLTQRSQVYLEPTLIDQLVQDLAGDSGEVRPIELQIVGSQLETEKITTLADYQQRGTKEKLVERFLEGVIHDCGKENKNAARLVLFLLTDENGTRPLKTRAELAADISTEADKLDLILEILVTSGLVFLLPEVPADRYQLVHDYLVLFIRQQQGLGLLAELENLRRQELLSQAEIERLRKEKELLAELSEAKEKQKKSESRLNLVLRGMLVSAMVGLMGMGYLAVSAIQAEQRAQSRREEADSQRQRAEINQIEAMSISSEALLPTDQLDALLSSVKMGKLLAQTENVPKQIRLRGMSALQRAVYEVQERNRIEGHSDRVLSVSFSPDGQQFVSAGEDNTLKLWSTTGKLLNTLTGHQNTVQEVAFSPDGELIASASHDKTIKIWNIDGTEKITLSGHDQEVIGVSFSPDGQRLASSSLDGTVRLWSREGKLLKTLYGHSSWVYSVAFSPDGRFLVSAGSNGLIRLWDSDGSWLETFGGHNDEVRSVNFSPDSKIIVSTSKDRTLKLWNTDGALLSTLTGHNDEVFDASFSPDGKTIASASLDRTIKLWSRDGRLLRTLTGHNDWVYSVAFRPDGKQIASASRDKTVRLWSASSTLRQNFTGHDGAVWNVSFNATGKTLVSAGEDATVRLWSVDGKLLSTLRGHTGPVIDVRFQPQGTFLVSASTDRTVRLWNAKGAIVKTITGHQDEVYSAEFSPDGKQLVSAGLDGTARLWDLTGRLIRELPGQYGTAIYSAVFSPDGKLIATATKDKQIKVWSVEGQLLKTLIGHGDEVYSVSFSPDGATLVSASRDTTIKLWRVETGELLKTLEGHSYAVENAIFSPDGNTIASVSDDQTIKLWNTADGTLLKTLDGHSNWVYGISFSPDGSILASASKDRTIRLWDTETLNFESLLERGCDFLQDYLETNARFEGGDDRHLCK